MRRFREVPPHLFMEVGEAHYAHCNCNCRIRDCSRIWVMSADYKSEQTALKSGFLYYTMAFSMAHTPHGQIPAQMLQPMQYLSSETYS